MTPTLSFARRPLVSALLIAAICWAVVGTTAALITPKPGYGYFVHALTGHPLFEGWVRWDARWYERIAREGYQFVPGEQSSVAYFPLYALLMRGLGATGLPLPLAGILITLACGLGGVVVFSRWADAQERAGKVAPGSASSARWLLLLWPYAFFLFGAVYSDALFFLLVCAAFWALERDEVWLATLLGAFATACRPIAPAVVAGLLARQLEKRWRSGERFRPIDLVPVLSAIGLLAWMAYQWHAFGTPIAFIEAQAGWHQDPGIRTWLKLGWFQSVHEPHVIGFAIPHALLALLFTALSVPTARKLGWGYGLYVLLAIGMPLVSSYAWVGLGRYALAAFPGFLTLADLLSTRPRTRWAFLGASALLLVFSASKFAAARYVS